MSSHKWSVNESNKPSCSATYSLDPTTSTNSSMKSAFLHRYSIMNARYTCSITHKGVYRHLYVHSPLHTTQITTKRFRNVIPLKSWTLRTHRPTFVLCASPFVWNRPLLFIALQSTQVLSTLKQVLSRFKLVNPPFLWAILLRSSLITFCEPCIQAFMYTAINVDCMGSRSWTNLGQAALVGCRYMSEWQPWWCRCHATTLITDPAWAGSGWTPGDCPGWNIWPYLWAPDDLAAV